LVVEEKPIDFSKETFDAKVIRRCLSIKRLISKDYENGNDISNGTVGLPKSGIV
jgi:hypothetical protein